MKKYDIAIIGAGVAGAFAALKLSENHKDLKSIIFDLGRPPGKRRRQLEGWFGCFPTGDGKIYTNNSEDLLNLIDGRSLRGANKWFMNNLSNVDKIKIIKDKLPTSETQKKITQQGFELKLNEYIQWNPTQIHTLSKNISDKIMENPNLTLSFDNEVWKIYKNKKKEFQIHTSDGDFLAKRIILCVGRSGWRWVNKLYKELGIYTNDDFAKFGIMVEMSSNYMKEFNKSHCSIYNKDISVGPLSWNGTVIPEDHADVAIASFRSNEERWRTDKVSFLLTGSQYYKDNGCNQMDRLAKLAFLLSNDRIGKEKIKTIVKEKSDLSLVPEYSWLPEAINKVSNFIPNILAKGYFHVPAIFPLISGLRLGNNLESEIEDLFIAGESAGLYGVSSAALTGGLAAEFACR